MSRYLDPKSDVVFKKIFGEHPHLLKSFLNAILPLSDDQQIVELEYLPVEQVPAIPEFKRTIVDVKCRDQQGQIFIVEMQVEWGKYFMQRLLFGCSQAYVKQLRPGEQYHLLNPVYGLGLIDSIFDKETPDWYHHYGLVRLDNPEQELINGLTLVFVELPKFKINTPEDKKLKVLWLRFMRELNEQTKEVDSALLAVSEIKEAIGLAEQAGYTAAELSEYEAYWKQVSSEKTLRLEALTEGLVKGREEGRVEGLAEGLVKGQVKALTEMAQKLKDKGMAIALIAELTGLSIEQIEKL
jgi:predicted transposase/invertase (TIGR01784 family)